MNTLNDAAMKKNIARAVELLQENARELLQSHTIGGDGNWVGEEEAKTAHDELVAVAENLERLLTMPVTAAATEQGEGVIGLRQALQFYADGNHFMPVDPDAWDSVSGEPANFLEDDAHTVTVEDGSVARLALSSHPLPA